MKSNASGQALLESVLVIAVTGVLLIGLIPPLLQSLQQRYHQGQHLQLQLQQAPLRSAFNLPSLDRDWLSEVSGMTVTDGNTSVTMDAAYPTATVLQPIWSILSVQRDFSLPTANRSLAGWSATEDTPPTLFFSALSDDWSPHTQAALQTRPQALTSTQMLQTIGFHHIQELMAWLPFAREFAPNNLRFGHVDIDVVPEKKLCQQRDCS